MIPPSVFCMAFSRLQADQMVQRPRAAAFPVHEMSVLFATRQVIAALGDMTQALVNLGVPLSKARLYEGSTREGHTLISVLTESDDKKTLAEQIFSKTGGDDLCASGELGTKHCPAASPHLVQIPNERLGVA